MEIEKTGMNVRRHKELIICMSDILKTHGSGQYIPASELIDLIANEPTFTKQDCVYLGLYLAANNTDKK